MATKNKGHKIQLLQTQKGSQNPVVAKSNTHEQQIMLLGTQTSEFIRTYETPTIDQIKMCTSCSVLSDSARNMFLFVFVFFIIYGREPIGILFDKGSLLLSLLQTLKTC